jgi:hypothetical protein
VEQLTPAQVIERSHPTSLRVTTTDSAEFVLHQPSMAGSDTLAGLRSGVPTRVAVSNVDHIAIRKVDAGLTAALVLMIGVAVVVATATAIGNSIDFSGWGGC